MATKTWIGTIGSWFTGANWDAGVPTASDDVVVDDFGDNIDVSGAVAAAATLNINRNNLLGVNTGGTLNVSGAINVGTSIGGSTLAVALGGDVTAGSLTIGGTGVASSSSVSVSGAGSTLLVAAASVSVGNGGAGGNLSISDGGAVTIGGGTGVLNLGDSGGSADGRLNFFGSGGTLNAASVNVANSISAVVFSNTSSMTFGVAITGAGRILKTDVGTTTLTGTNTNSGTTLITAGILQVGNGGTAGSISSNVDNRSELRFNRSDDLTFSGNVFGVGGLSKFGAGKLTLTGDGTYTGSTNIAAGTLQIGNGATSGWLNGTSQVFNQGTLIFSRSDSATFSAVIDGTGALVKDGAGTITLTGVNTYQGDTTINAGTLALSGAGRIADSAHVGGSGTFNIGAISAASTTIQDLQGSLTVIFTGKALVLANQTSIFTGVLDGSGGNASLTTNGSNVSLANASFANWTPGSDSITINGTTAADQLTGSLTVDAINGGRGNDQMRGNGGNDVVNGNGGRDVAVFTGTAATATRVHNLNGTWSITAGADGTDILTNVEIAQFADRRVVLEDPLNDFNADATSDLLWFQQSTGTALIRNMANNAVTGGVNISPVGADWTIQATGDFNGDGSSDFAWKNTTTGQFFLWNYYDNAQTGSANLGVIGTNWNIKGSGDFNNDGTGDIVWNDASNGHVYLYMMQNNAIASSASLGIIGAEWSVGAVGDFNGDGSSDILLRRSTDGLLYTWSVANGAIIDGDNYGALGSNWNVAGAGDFNGDGTDDVLLRNATDGQLYIWNMGSSANIVGGANLGAIGSEWTVDAIYDTNGDYTADIMLKNTVTGRFYLWGMQNNAIASSADLGTLGTDWQLI